MADTSRGQLNFLVLGHSPKGATGWPHPVTISIHPRGRTTLLNFSMGHHIVNVGGQIPVTQVILDGELNETFAEEFDACEARWLVPRLAQLAAGENVTVNDLIETYQSMFGHRPKVERSGDYTF
ncbi:hypothetical protein MWU75_02555 [Ornithinimicrobium sp. F0845]|uniref:hypothetical protein n=1 Tax=Ornithinimicrobium sp. F0845 TaxID=2926412 RepID=UPI001FF58923|nr:hypothetical protein [Ornithinimicrobium sp. F0845]MCK0111022.1 hypothetical protein [Ornithinimicrobium sp. F0845]